MRPPPNSACSSPNSLHPTDQALYLVAHAAQRRAVRSRKRRLARKQASESTEATVQTTPAQEPKKSARQLVGDAYEARACAMLVDQGFEVLGQQLRCPAGETDLVARTPSGILVFVEVRARSSLTHGGAAQSVTRCKQTRLIRAARWWLGSVTAQHFGGKTPACRFDVITFDPSGIRWIKDAFRPGQDK